MNSISEFMKTAYTIIDNDELSKALHAFINASKNKDVRYLFMLHMQICIRNHLDESKLIHDTMLRVMNKSDNKSNNKHADIRQLTLWMRAANTCAFYSKNDLVIIGELLKMAVGDIEQCFALELCETHIENHKKIITYCSKTNEYFETIKKR